MLKMRNGGLVVLGLSDLNLERLREGKPIMFDGSELHLEGVDKLAIFYGPTEADMLQMIEDWRGRQKH